DPKELRYNKTHEWIAFDAETNTITTGITKFAVGALGDLVYVELPEIGELMEIGHPYAEVESVKAVANVYGGVSADITGINEELPDNLDWLVKDPYGKGWIAKGKVPNGEEFELLMDFEAYEKHCASEKDAH
ncbi:MAG: glycine cleavage system protein GcvH, partial [Planctomycetota bacterium]